MHFSAEGGNAGSRITLRQTQVCEGVIEVQIHYILAEPSVPEPFSISTSVPNTDIYSMWSPAMPCDRTMGATYDWRNTPSRLATWMPLHAAVSHTGRNRLLMALSDATVPAVIRSGVCEADGELRWLITLFTTPTTAISDYTVTLRVDSRDIPLYDSVYDTVAWWETACGYIPAPVPEHARLPVNSLWYSFHQALDPDEIVRQCALSVPLGMKTVIIDDGWQTDRDNLGYSTCGDWRPKRIPDMKGLVERIHQTGMQVMLWFSVPYVGVNTENYPSLKPFVLDPDGELDYYRLDPRYPHIRDYLVGIYADAVSQWDLDGLKLDFIDAFGLTAASIQPDARRDCESLEEGIDRLMKAVVSQLRAIKPDILLEFRQSYVGPAIRQYGNMLRVGDCPTDPIANRVGIVDLRMTSGRTAVHSDMLMWHVDDTKENVACQLIATLYGVPQISMRIDELCPEHYATLRFYLDFWMAHRDILLDGRLTFKNPETLYSQVTACLDGHCVVTVYENRTVEGDCLTLCVVNGSSEETVYLKGMQGKAFRVVDCTGVQTARGVADSALCEVAVPRGGILFAE